MALLKDYCSVKTIESAIKRLENAGINACPIADVRHEAHRD